MASSLGPSVSLSASASSTARAMPTARATASVPARRPPCWAPPRRRGAKEVPFLTRSAPTPFGPWTLCAEIVARSTGNSSRSRRRLPTTWTASV